MGAWAQESRAVLAIELGEGDELERVDSEIVAAIVAAYELELGWTMTQQEMQATLSTGQILAGDSAKIQSLVSGLQRGEDAFYEASPKAAEMLEEATQKALSQPMLLTLDKRLAEQSKNALLVLARAYLGEARFDEAAQTTTRMVESFPTYIPSSPQLPAEGRGFGRAESQPARADGEEFGDHRRWRGDLHRQYQRRVDYFVGARGAGVVEYGGLWFDVGLR